MPSLSVLEFFSATGILTLMGIMYWMTTENLGHLKSRFILAAALSFILTPMGAWAVSTIIKAMTITQNNTNVSPS